MAASAEQNEIIELTDLIEKGPDLPKNSPKTPEPLPLPDEAPATAAPAPDDLLLLPVQDHEPVPSPAPAVEDVPPARDWEAQLDASAAVIGDTGLHLAALAAQTGTESPLLPESLERISSLEESCRQLDRRLSALEGQAGNGHSDATLLMETVERLTHLEEQVQALPATADTASGSMAGAPDSVLLMESMERLSALEGERQEMLQRLDSLESQTGGSHSDGTLLMETVERLTHLEEQVQALQDAPAASGEVPATADSERVARLEEERRMLAQRVEALEHQLGDLMTDFDKYVERRPPPLGGSRILHEEIRAPDGGPGLSGLFPCAHGLFRPRSCGGIDLPSAPLAHMLTDGLLQAAAPQPGIKKKGGAAFRSVTRPGVFPLWVRPFPSGRVFHFVCHEARYGQRQQGSPSGRQGADRQIHQRPPF